MARLDSVGDPVRIAQRRFRLLHFVRRTLRILTGANTYIGIPQRRTNRYPRHGPIL
jgi:hypothetical protein